MIEIDGSVGEAGGQVLRISCALSALTKKPVRVFNIRKNRPKPGLAEQHLSGIRALAQLSGGSLEGGFLGSSEIEFSPGNIFSDSISVKIETAGSITLALQTLIVPSLAFKEPVKIYFEGGATDTFFSPTFDYFQYVFLKILEKMEGKIKANLIKRGYFPEGGARVEIKICPSKIKSLNLTRRGDLKKILMISGASDHLKDKKVAERQLFGARELLGKLNLPMEERVEYYDTSCPGSQILIAAEFENTSIGTDNLGKLGKRAEEVGREAALALLKEEKSGACLDKNMADQILPFMALSSKKSQITVSQITSHTKTNIKVIEKFVEGVFEIKDNLITFSPL
jgi:RNA 3'-phosphate cyclase